jgi:MinD-like ATPase involved in chromosome partitioning or flagellar assembly/ActR/RegA family two-component response regulator
VSAERILIVDGDPASLKYMAYSIGKAGFEVYTANTGKEGLITAWRERPHFIVIDPKDLGDITIEELYQKLRSDPRTAKRPLIAFSTMVDPLEAQQVVDLGFDHFLPKDSEALPALLDIFQGVGVPIRMPQPPPVAPSMEKRINRPEGKTIVFLSAKGGMGTSSLCANLATMFAELFSGKKVAVVDLVLPLGSIAPIVGYDGPLNFCEASSMGPDEITVEYLQKSLPGTGLWKFQLLAGCSDPNEAQELEIAEIPDLLKKLRQAFDYVLIDLGRALSRISLPIILSADQLVLIVGPDQSTVKLTKTVIDYLRTKGLQNMQIYPLLNRAVGLEGMIISKIEEILGLSVTAAIPHIGSEFVLANNLNQPLSYKLPDNVATIAFRQAAQEIERRAQEVREKGFKTV